MRRVVRGLASKLHAALVLVLLLGLVPLPALPAAALAGAPGDGDPVPAEPLTADIPADPQLPGLALAVTVAPDPLAVGQVATLTVTVLNEGDDPAEDLVVAVPAAAGAAARPAPAGTPGDGYDAASGGWRWVVGRLDGGAQVAVSGTFLLTSAPPGDAVLFVAAATAAGLPRPAMAEGGALVVPDAGGAGAGAAVAAFALPAATPAASPTPGRPGADPRATEEPFVPGRPATLTSRDGRVRVAVPADAAHRPLTLSHATAPGHGERVPPAQAGPKRGLGTFYLGARDAGRAVVHRLKAPVAITVAYTPEQLRARGIAEVDLALYYYDEAAENDGRWVAVPTTVDTDRREATAMVDHFTAFQLSDGSQPSKNYLPNVADWQVALFTGAATYSMPLELPAGAGGMKPDLTLSYNSQQMDGKAGKRPKGRAGWAGLGWNLELPSIALQKTYADNVVNYSLSLNGINTQLVRGDATVGSPDPLNPTHWQWRTADESYIRLAAIQSGTTNGSYAAPMTSGRSLSTHQGALPRYYWKVRLPDNGTYVFAEDLWQGYNNCAATQSVDFEQYKWYLTTATDRHGNTIDYSYTRVESVGSTVACGGGSSATGTGTVQIDARPTTITWGGGRYRVDFRQSSRTDDSQSDCPDNQYPGCTAVPRVTGVLDGIWVYSKQASSWEGVRGWVLSHDYSLKSDNTINGNQADVYNRLTLTSIQRIGRHTMPTLPTVPGSYSAPALPALGLTYDATRGTGSWPNADWNRLVTANNNQGGTVTYAYEQIGQVTGKSIFANHRRVTGRTVTDGRGNSYAWAYQYSSPMLNSLGSIIQPSDPNATSTYVNSAALYLAWGWGGNWAAQRTHLQTPDNEEFRGHAWVKEVRPDGSWSEHWFRQGDAGCTPTATGTNTASYDADSCFVQVREREFLRGKEYQVEQKSAGGTVLARTESAFGVSFLGYATPEIGVWRAWTFPTARYESAVEGSGSPVVKTTNYAYDASYQLDNSGNPGGQRGNLTRIAEYAGDYRVTGASTPRLRLTERWYNTNDDGSSVLLVNLVREERVRGATDGEVLGHTRYFYDSYVTATGASFGVGSTGDLKLVRKYVTPAAPGATSTGGVDTGMTYDSYGNALTTTTYGTYATESGPNAPFVKAGGTSPAPRTTTTVYDPVFHAFPTSVTPPDPNGVGLTETATYDYRMGLILSVTDANGVVTTMGDPANQVTYPGYDDFGRPIALVKHGDSPSYPTSRIYYDDAQQPVRYRLGQREVAGASGARWTTFFYDGLGRQIQTTREAASGTSVTVTDTRYDGLGRATQQALPYLQTVADGANVAYAAPGGGVVWSTTAYDGLGRPTSATDAANKTTTTSYALATLGVAATTTDANAHRTERQTDVFGRLRAVLEYGGNNGTEGAYALYATTTYAYDGRDLLTAATDAAGNVSSMVYDGLGRKTSMHDPDMGNWAYTYNPSGTLATQTDAKSQGTSFAYDTLDRLTSRTTSADGRVLGYSYDSTAGGNQGKGRQTGTSVTVGGTTQQTTASVYDTRGRVASLATWTSALGGTRTFGYAYDSADRQTTITYPTGEVVTNSYDAGWRQTSACSSLGGCYASGATYNALDAPTAWTYGNSLGQSVGYDVLGRVNSIQVGGGSVLNLGYTYDNVGNVATNTDTLNSQTQNYTYDHRDRLTHAWTTGSGTAAYDESYTYNAIGNITGKGPTGSLATYGYNASGASSVRPHAVTAVGSDVYQYDGNGNLTSRTGKTITWNVDNTVASVVGPDNVPEGYSYDVNGQRVTRSRNLGQPGGFTTVYCGGLYEEDTPSGDKRLLYTFAGRVVAQRTIPSSGGSGTVVYLHGDLLGSTGATTSNGGGVTATQRYTPFGSVRAGGSLPTTIGFTGQRQDGTGLSYYNARYYDPAIGRFASADDIGVDRANPQTRNRYSYVTNNPLRYADPSGHEPDDHRPDKCRLPEYAQQCRNYAGEFAAYGIDIQNLDGWALYELHWVLRGVEMLADAFGGGGNRDRRIELFKRALHITPTASSRLQFNYVNRLADDGHYAEAGGTTVTFYANTFYSYPAGGRPFREDLPAEHLQRTVRVTVHELAHLWDERTGPVGNRNSDRMGAWLPRQPNPGEPPPNARGRDGREDWAESVAQLVINPAFQNTARADFIKTTLCEVSRCNAPPDR